MKRGGCLAVVCVGLLVSLADARKPGRQDDEASRARSEMQAELGLVPVMFDALPEIAVGPAWEEMKGLMLSDETELSTRQKDLIGLAVAAQVPCDSCVYYHQKVARARGASDQAVKEAVTVAAMTRQLSTVLNGILLDERQFRRDTDQLMSDLGRRSGPLARVAAGEPEEEPIRTPNDAYADMRRTLGRVPLFFQAFPEEGVVGAWKQFKLVQMGEATALSGKEKELIGLAVAAQIPCSYCVYFHTQAAKRAGATEEEIHEALGVAAFVRHFSTVLNGMEVDERAFRRDVDAMIRTAERREATREREKRIR